MLDEGVQSPWPDDVREANAPFKQGDLIEKPPFYYMRANGIRLWGRSDDEAEASEDDFELVELVPEGAPPYGIITTQTCDLSGEGAEPRLPWFQVAPVYKVDGSAAQSLLFRLYITRLTAPQFASEVWVADLRIELTFEKGILVGRTPIESFEDERGYIDFAELLGRRRARAALADVLVEVVSQGIKTKRSGTPNVLKKRVWASLQPGGLRLSIDEGTRLEPKDAMLHVVTRGPASEELQEWFAEWWDEARPIALERGFSLLTTQFHDGTCIDAEMYRELVDLGLV
jgi:hypothetical protein